MISELAPDLILLDIRMGKYDRLELLQHIRRLFYNLVIQKGQVKSFKLQCVFPAWECRRENSGRHPLLLISHAFNPFAESFAANGCRPACPPAARP
jgi:hypothetical protein